MNTEIYFNGQQAYFDKEEIITGTYALNSVGDLKSRQGIKTNTYSLPFVKQNKAIFSDSELIANEGTGPYVRYEHEVIIEGVSVFKGSAFVIESFGVYKVQAVGGNSDFYLLLTNKTLADLDYSDLDHVRNNTNIIASWDNTVGYIYPFIDYGQYQLVTNSSIGSDDSQNIINPTDLYPAIFLKTVIQKISDFTGYIFKGNVLALTRFNEEIIPFTSFPFVSEDDEGLFEGINRRSTLPARGTNFITFIEIEDPDNLYDAYGFYTNHYTKNIRISIDFDNFGQLSGEFFIVKRLALFETNYQGIASYDEIIISSNTSGTKSITVFVNPGERIFVMTSNPSFTTAVNVVINSFKIETVEVHNGYGLTWKFSKNLPDIDLNKFILDFMNRYGLSIQTDNELRIVTFNFEDDILTNEQVDWSGKIDYSNKSQTDLQDVFYRLDNYTQNNLLTYKTYDWLPNGFEYIFTIDDEYLPTETYTDFESEFSLAPLGASFLGAVQTINVNMFKIKPPLVFRGYSDGSSSDFHIDDVVFYKNGLYKALVDNPASPPITNDFYDDPNWKSLNAEDIWEIKDGIPLITRIHRYFTGPSVDFQGTGLTEIKVFGINTDMDWPTIWVNHYQALKRMLVKTKIAQIPLRLNYSDIANLNLTRQVWIKELGLHFKADEVIQFKFNQVDSTLVRLIRL